MYHSNTRTIKFKTKCGVRVFCSSRPFCQTLERTQNLSPPLNIQAPLAFLKRSCSFCWPLVDFFVVSSTVCVVGPADHPHQLLAIVVDVLPRGTVVFVAVFLPRGGLRILCRFKVELGFVPRIVLSYRFVLFSCPFVLRRLRILLVFVVYLPLSAYLFRNVLHVARQGRLLLGPDH